MKKALIVIVVVAVAGFGVWYFKNHNSTKSTTTTPTTTPAQTNSTTTPAAAANTVTFDGSAFSPASLTVKSGTTVTFTNNSDTPVWPASDPHPTHTDLPGFDANKGLTKGESYSFTFVKVGSWGYHNHLSSGEKGTIVVQ